MLSNRVSFSILHQLADHLDFVKFIVLQFRPNKQALFISNNDEVITCWMIYSLHSENSVSLTLRENLK
jgi:hypothetical protein